MQCEIFLKENNNIHIYLFTVIIAARIKLKFYSEFIYSDTFYFYRSLILKKIVLQDIQTSLSLSFVWSWWMSGNSITESEGKCKLRADIRKL